MSTHEEVVYRLLQAFTGADLALMFREDSSGGAIGAGLREVAEPGLETELIGPGGFKTTVTGIDGLLKAWADWTAPFSSYRIELEGEPFGDDDRLVTFTRQLVTPVGTDATIEQDAASVWFSRGEKVWRIEFHLDRDAALRAAGLPTP